MRDWIVVMGLSWDRWWSYCHRLQQAMNIPGLSWMMGSEGVAQHERPKETHEDAASTTPESQSPMSPVRLAVPGAHDRSERSPAHSTSRSPSKQLSSHRPSVPGLPPEEKARLKRIM